MIYIYISMIYIGDIYQANPVYNNPFNLQISLCIKSHKMLPNYTNVHIVFGHFLLHFSFPHSSLKQTFIYDFYIVVHSI